MNRWLPVVVALGLAGLARGAIVTPALSAPEADTLAGAALFAEALTQDAPAGQRLRAAFRPDPKQPRVAQLKGARAWRAVGSAPPLPRWVGGLGVALAGGDTALDGARWGAALAVSLALALLAWAAGRAAGRAAAWAALVLLVALPGTLQAATAAGYDAAALLASAALLAAMRALTTHPRASWGLVVGVALGLTWGVHPGAFALVVPVFAALAIARSSGGEPPPQPSPGEDDGDPGAAGTLPLPWVPWTALAAPAVALVTLVALWPALWSHTGKGLLAWATDTWRLAAPAQAVAGVVFDQVHGRAPQAWTALYQWTAWTPLPLLAAWLVGLGVTVRAGRRGGWFPVLALAALLVVGGINGGLFGFRNSLLAMTLPFTAATAALGAVAAAGWVRGRLGRHRWSAPAAWALVAALGLGPVGYEQARGGYVPRGGSNGAEVALPLPLPLLREIEDATPKAAVAMVGGGTSWRRSFEVLWGDVGVPLNLRPPAVARWLVVVDDPHAPGVRDLPAPGPGGRRPAPDLRAVAGGVPFVAYDRGAAPPRRPSKGRHAGRRHRPRPTTRPPRLERGLKPGAPRERPRAQPTTRPPRLERGLKPGAPRERPRR